MANLGNLLNLILEEPCVLICDNEMKLKLLSELDFIAPITFKSPKDAENDLLGFYDDIVIYLIKHELNVKYDRAKLIYDSLIISEYINDNDLLDLRLKFKKYYHEKKNYNKRIIVATKTTKLLDYALKDNDNVIYYEYEEINNIRAYQYKNIINEVESLANKIANIYKENNLNNFDDFAIYIGNESYFNIIKNIFPFYNIPISYQFSESLYTVPKVREIVNELDLNNINLDLIKDDNVKDVFIKCLNKLAIIDYDKDDLVDELSNTSLKSNIKGIKLLNINQLNPFFKYTFIVGFTFKNVPSIHKDDLYYKDEILKQYGFNTSFIENKKEKEFIKKNILAMENVDISYSSSGIGETFIESDLLDGIIEFKEDNTFKFNYSKARAMLDYNKSIEQRMLTGEENEYLSSYKKLFGYVDKFEGSFKGIDPKLINEKIVKNNNIKASYSKIEKYMECPFKYYCSYILKLEEYNDNVDIGLFVHKYLEERIKDKNYTIDDALNEINKEKANPLILREPYYSRYKDILDKLIKAIEMEDELNGFELVGTEIKKSVVLSNNPTITLDGSIDKVLKKNDKYIIIDYKSGKKISLDKNPLEEKEKIKSNFYKKYQLFIYLIYLDADYEKFEGVFYQKVMPSDKKEFLSLDSGSIFVPYGYKRADSDLDYKVSGRSNGLINEEQYNEIISNTKDLILSYKEDLMNARFDIRPLEGICKYCSFKNVCYYSFKEEVDDNE